MTTTNYASINPDDQPTTTTDEDSGAFSALVKVVKSRYDKQTYPPEMNIPDRVVTVWEMQTTRGKVFDRTYSTGWSWGEVQISADGKHISAAPKAKSDTMYLIQKAVGSGFPKTKITNDISVFEGECFFVRDDINTKASGSKKKPYPKEYKAEGWEKALNEALARQAANNARRNPQQNAQAALQSTNTVPKVVQLSSDVLTAASGALVEILASNGGKVNQNDIIAKLNPVADGKGWKPAFRQEVTLALWHGAGGNLQSVISSSPTLALVEETVTFK